MLCNPLSNPRRQRTASAQSAGKIVRRVLVIVCVMSTFVHGALGFARCFLGLSAVGLRYFFHGFKLAGCFLKVCRVATLAATCDEIFAGDTLENWIAMHEDLRQSASCRAVFDALVDGLARHAGA